MTTPQQSTRRRGAVPRGLAETGPVLFSYGFRPFFLAGALWAVAAMALWIGALAAGLEPGGSYGAVHWHAHEMLFGFGTAVLAGFLLTAVPNWTGRLPVSSRPLMALFALWCAGRLSLLFPDVLSHHTGLLPAVLIDMLFLPALLFISAREVIAGRKWKDLKVIAGLLALSLANGLFHAETLTHLHGALHHGTAARLAAGTYAALVMVVGGRIIPSFTRNWLNRAGATHFPASYDRFDSISIVSGVAALAAWTLSPEAPLTALAAAIAALLHLVRLYRWRGFGVRAESLLLVLHAAYLFVSFGFAAIALGATGTMSEPAVLHVLTVGVMATMMLAVMTRATRGHTGRALAASRITEAGYLAIILAAVLRPAADALPGATMELYALSGALWIAAFGLFLAEHAPMLLFRRRGPLSG